MYVTCMASYPFPMPEKHEHAFPSRGLFGFARLVCAVVVFCRERACVYVYLCIVPCQMGTLLLSFFCFPYPKVYGHLSLHEHTQVCPNEYLHVDI